MRYGEVGIVVQIVLCIALFEKYLNIFKKIENMLPLTIYRVAIYTSDIRFLPAIHLVWIKLRSDFGTIWRQRLPR